MLWKPFGTVTKSVADTVATTIDAAAVVVTAFTVATQTTTSVLLQQPLLSHVVLSVPLLPLPPYTRYTTAHSTVLLLVLLLDPPPLPRTVTLPPLLPTHLPAASSPLP